MLGRIAGIPLVADPSWFLQVAVLTLIARANITGFVIGRDAEQATAWIVSIALALGIVACIVTHELAHSVVARAYGLPVKRIVLFVLGGVSQIEREAPNPRAEAAIAVAGPLTSMLIACALGGVGLLLEPGAVHLRESSPWGWFATINWFLAAFNLLPAFPMDGGRVLRSALWRGLQSRPRATRVAARAGQGFASLLGVAGLGKFWADSASGGGASADAIWLVLLALFLFQAAGSAGRAESAERPNEREFR